MRVKSIQLLVSILVFAVAASACNPFVPNKPADPSVAIEVDGRMITLQPGVNVNSEIYQAALNPEFIANSDWVLVNGYWEPLAKGVSIPVEAAQLILPDGHPEFPADTAWVVASGAPQPVEVPIPLAFPASWQGSYDVRTEGNAVHFDFTGDPAGPAVIFSITALTEAEWLAMQNEPHGEAVFSYDGIVWVYNPALENLLSGEYADRFSQMVGEAGGIAQSLAGYFTPRVDPETTRPVLQAYFDALGAGNYADAALIYGGELEVLAGYNPDLDPADRAGLFERACTVNGFACSLQIGDILNVEQVSDLVVLYTLALQNPDGSMFELGPCCGADPAATPPQREFTFTVGLQDGRLVVLELPVYVP